MDSGRNDNDLLLKEGGIEGLKETLVLLNALMLQCLNALMLQCLNFLEFGESG